MKSQRSRCNDQPFLSKRTSTEVDCLITKTTEDSEYALVLQDRYFLHESQTMLIACFCQMNDHLLNFVGIMCYINTQ